MGFYYIMMLYLHYNYMGFYINFSRGPEQGSSYVAVLKSGDRSALNWCCIQKQAIAVCIIDSCFQGLMDCVKDFVAMYL